MAGITNKAKFHFMRWIFREDEASVTIPSDFYIALCLGSVVPDADTDTLSDLEEISTGNGYNTAGGRLLDRDSATWDVATENDASDYGNVQLKDIVWTASGGPIPSAGSGARYAVLLDDNGTAGNRLVLAYWDLTSNRSVSDGQSLTLQDCELRFTET